MNSSSPKSYLPHLDGIRALAIVLVVLFHMHEKYVPNGYYGVDAFLVLSGYLLVGRHLMSDKPFLIFNFVKLRLSRLLPPMLLTFAVTLCAATVLIPDLIFVGLVDSFLSVLELMPNKYLADVTTDYFAADARKFPIMHLWYMGVVFQAYFIFAILFYLWNVFKFKLGARILTLALVFFASFAIHLSWLGTYFSDNSIYSYSTYYFTSARLWEFCLGGFMCLLPGRKEAKEGLWGELSAFLAVAVMLVGSFVKTENSTHYIPLYAICSCLLIRYGTCPYISRLLCNRYLTSIGKISFSIYLTHWPVIYFCDYYGLEKSFFLSSGLFAVIFLSAFMLYMIAEVRRWSITHTIVLWVSCSMLYFAVKEIGSLRDKFLGNIVNLNMTEYTPHALPSGSPLYEGTERLPRWTGSNFVDVFVHHMGDETKEPTFLLLGDSHAMHLIPGMDVVGKEKGWSGIYITTYFVPFGKTEETQQGGGSSAPLAPVVEWLDKHPSITHIVLSQYWERRICKECLADDTLIPENRIEKMQNYSEELYNWCEPLTRNNRTLILLTENPKIACKNAKEKAVKDRLKGDSCTDMQPSTTCTKERYEQQTANSQSMLLQLKEKLGETCSIVHIEDAMFTDGVFCYIQDNELLMRDTNHLTAAGAEKAIRGVADVLFDLLKK